MTALDARGKRLGAAPVTNEKVALRKYFRQFRGQSVQVAVEACVTRLKNQVHAVLHQQGLRSPMTDVFGKRGRLWLREVKLPEQARESVGACLRMIDCYTEEIQKQTLQLGEKAKQDERVQWLMTIPGIGEVSAMMVLAEIGDLGRFADPEALCSYAGLVPRVRESAGKAARGGIARQGSPWLRWMMVEAAQVATRTSPAARRY
jgi:transposase